MGDGVTPPRCVDDTTALLLAQVGMQAAYRFAQELRELRLLPNHAAVLQALGTSAGISQRALPRSIRRMLRPTFDPKSTPFIERLDDVKRIYLALPEPVSVAFAIGVFGGLRTAEVLGLDWGDVNVARARIHVRRQVNNGRLAVLKDDESRIVPVLAPLAPIFAAWKLRTGGEGLRFKPTCPTRGGRPGQSPSFMRPHTLHRHLAKALAACGFSALTWYQATRHTFASQWVLAGGSIEKLKEIMGHSSVVVTERYAHLKPELFRAADYQLLDVDLSGHGQVVQLMSQNAKSGAVGYAVVTDPEVVVRAEPATV